MTTAKGGKCMQCTYLWSAYQATMSCIYMLNNYSINVILHGSCAATGLRCANRLLCLLGDNQTVTYLYSMPNACYTGTAHQLTTHLCYFPVSSEDTSVIYILILTCCIHTSRYLWSHWASCTPSCAADRGFWTPEGCVPCPWALSWKKSHQCSVPSRWVLHLEGDCTSTACCITLKRNCAII